MARPFHGSCIVTPDDPIPKYANTHWKSFDMGPKVTSLGARASRARCAHQGMLLNLDPSGIGCNPVNEYISTWISFLSKFNVIEPLSHIIVKERVVKLHREFQTWRSGKIGAWGWTSSSCDREDDSVWQLRFSPGAPGFLLHYIQYCL
jgi:hypothetical protein